jgi:hypothetical protein
VRAVADGMFPSSLTSACILQDLGDVGTVPFLDVRKVLVKTPQRIPHVLVVGKRGKGKSTWVMAAETELQVCRGIDQTYYISEVEQHAPPPARWVRNPNRAHVSWMDQMLSAMNTHYERHTGPDDREDNGGPTRPSHSIIIVEDFPGVLRGAAKARFLEYLQEASTHNILVIFTIQYVLDFDPDMARAFGVQVYFADLHAGSRGRIQRRAQRYFGIHLSDELFNSIQGTHRTFVIDCRVDSPTPIMCSDAHTMKRLPSIELALLSILRSRVTPLVEVQEQLIPDLAHIIMGYYEHPDELTALHDQDLVQHRIVFPPESDF